MIKDGVFFQKVVDAFEDLADWLNNNGYWKATKTMMFLFFVAVMCLMVIYGYRVVKQININSEILQEAHQTPEDLQIGFIKSVEDNLMVEQIMTQCLYEHDADSIIVAKFHNSKTDLQGKHDFFYSGTNEVVKRGVSGFVPEMQNVPIVRLGRFVIPYLEHRCQVINVEEDIVNNNWLLSKLRGENINTKVGCPIYDNDGRNLLGFTELIYLNSNKNVVDGKVDVDDYIMKCFKETTSKISNIIGS